MDDETLRILRLRFRNAARNIIRRGRTSCSIDFDESNLFRRSGRAAEEKQKSQARKRNFHFNLPAAFPYLKAAPRFNRVHD